MRNLFAATFAASIVLSAGVLNGATGEWELRDGVGASPENAATWADAANWKGGFIPLAAADGVYITNRLSAPLYVKAGDPLSISWINGASGAVDKDSAVPFIIADEGVVLNVSSRNPAFSGVRLYADLHAPHASGAAHFCNGFLCGDVQMNFLSVPDGILHHRLDLYANNAGEVRDNALSLQSYRNSWGAFRIYAPQSSPVDIEGVWAQTAGSAYLRRVGEAHALSVGTIVRGAGIKEGTFLKRVFTDGLIELSEAVETTFAEGNTLVFEAFTPDVTLRIGTIYRQNTSTDNVRLMKCRKEDSLRCLVDSIDGGAANIAVFDTDDGFFPGTFVISRITQTDLPRLRFGNCHFEFTASGSGESGFPFAGARMVAAGDQARFTVPDGVFARIGSFTNLVGTVVKDGAGTLTTTINDMTSLNTGAIVVEEGSLALEGGAGLEPAYVKTLAISNGATLKLPPNGLRVDVCEIEPGAVVTGEGALTLAGGPVPEGLVLAGGATVGFRGGSGMIFAEPVAAEVAGVPAFWVDVSNEKTVTFENVNGTNFVSKIADVRGEEYGFATNLVNRPWMVEGALGERHIYFQQTSTAGIENGYGLIWDKFIYGIKHVFLVHCPLNGGGPILGVSGALWKKHYQSPFLRDAGALWHSDLVWGGGLDSVVNGHFYQNGEPSAYDAGYLYSGHYQYGNGNYYTPVVLEVAPLSSVHADCFGYDSSAANRNGRQRLCECIVYTNDLSKAERNAITRHLMKKWINAEVGIERGAERNSFGAADFDGGSHGYDVSEGETGWLDSVAGEGTLVKSGGGVLTIPEFSNASVALHVKSGKVNIASARMTRETLPGGAYLHLDASEASTVATNVVDGIARVTSWTGIDDDQTVLTAVANSTNMPVYLNDACNGKPAVDFGPRRDLREIKNARPDLLLPKEKEKRAAVKTVIAVMDSSQGGGSLLPTCGYAYNVCVGLMRANYGKDASGADALIGAGLGPTNNQTDNNEGTGITRARINGKYVKPRSTGLSGGWDIVSLANHYALGVVGLGSDHYGYYAGGQRFAEYILYPKMLSRQEVEAVEAYLREKWFGIETPGYLPTRAKSVAVDDGAVLQLKGGAVETAAFVCSGRIEGGVSLVENAVLTAVVGADGTVGASVVTGTLDLSRGGTVMVTGCTEALESGRYVIADAGGVVMDSAARWNCVFDDTTNFKGTLAAVDGKLTLKISKSGFTMIVR